MVTVHRRKQSKGFQISECGWMVEFFLSKMLLSKTWQYEKNHCL